MGIDGRIYPVSATLKKTKGAAFFRQVNNKWWLYAFGVNYLVVAGGIKILNAAHLMITHLFIKPAGRKVTRGP